MFWKVWYQGTRSKRHHLQSRLGALTFNCSDMQCIVLANRLRGIALCSTSYQNFLQKKQDSMFIYYIHMWHCLGARYANHSLFAFGGRTAFSQKTPNHSCPSNLSISALQRICWLTLHCQEKKWSKYHIRLSSTLGTKLNMLHSAVNSKMVLRFFWSPKQLLYLLEMALTLMPSFWACSILLVS